MYSIFTFFYNSQEFYGDKRSKAALFLVPNVGRYWGNQIIWGSLLNSRCFLLYRLWVWRELHVLLTGL